MVLAVVVYLPVAALSWPLPPLARSRALSGWAHFVLWWLKLTCGLRHRVEGLENLPARPGVLLCNHQSTWETIALQTIFPPQAWVVKRELYRIPLFGWGLALSRPIAIDRGSSVKALDQLLRQGVERLREGRWVVVFPEGTRVPPGALGRFNPGGAALAVRAGAPLVPVVHDAGRYWKRRGFCKRGGVIAVRVGPAIDATGRKAREVNAQARAWMENAMAGIEDGGARL